MTKIHIHMKAFKLALALGTAALLCAPSVTYAEPGADFTFRPAQSWQVNSGIQNTAGASTQRCQISAEFNNGFILQFDGSHKWVETLSLNLRQSALQKGERYPITLSVPGNAKLSLQGTAADTSTIVAPLSGQKDFYDALLTNAVLDVDIEGNEFRFYMVNFAASSKTFEQCMAGGHAPAPKTQPGGELLHASKSEDPYAHFTTNEAIALEEAETVAEDASAAMTNGAAPSARTIPYEAKTPQDAEKYAAAEPSYEPKSQDTRFTDTLAAEMQTDSALSTTAPTEKAAPAPKETPAPAPAKVAAQDSLAGGKALYIPPSLNETPLDAPQRAAAEDLNQQQLQKLAAKEPAPAPEPAEMSGEFMPEAEPAAQEPAPKTVEVEKISTPAIKYNREVSRMEADFTGIEPASNSAEPFSRDPDIGRKISQLEQMINTLESENAALKDELSLALTESKQESMAISSDNWNLERATMRYTEAERQLKILGGQLQRERAQCDVEKKNLETMLFDPSITDQQQMSRLAELERQLQEARQQLQTYEARFGATQSGG